MLKNKWNNRGKDHELMSTIMRGKVAFFDHLQREDQFPPHILEEKLLERGLQGARDAN